MIKTKTKSGKDFYIPLGNDNKIIQPIYIYLKHLVMVNMSKNTVRNNCLYLLEFFSYLEQKDYDYLEFVGEKSDTCKGAYENLTDYRLFLLYPDKDDKIIPIGGIPQKRKESTVNQMMSSVISFYKFLSDSGIIKDLPVIQQMKGMIHSNHILREMFLSKHKAFKSLYLSKVPEEPIRYINEEDFEKCWQGCTNRRNRIIIGLMYYAGLRVSEVVGLNLADLKDIHKNIIHVALREDPDNPDAAVKYGSVGSVVTDDRLRDEIVSYMNEDLRGIDTNYLIINFSGRNMYGAMKTDTIRDMLKNLEHKIGLPQLHPHMFRHGCAMRMMRAEMDIMEISDKLRHKSIQTTAGTYAKMDIGDKIKTQEKLSKKLHEDFKPFGIDFQQLYEMIKEKDDE